MRKGVPARGAAAMVVAAGMLAAQQSPVAGDVARGAALYAEHCASCHGEKLEGAPDWRIRGADGLYPAPPHDGTGHTWHHGDRLLFDYTRLGGEGALAALGVTDFESGMPGFGHVLGDDEIRDVLAFIRSTWPEAIRRHQERLTRQEAEAQARPQAPP